MCSNAPRLKSISDIFLRCFEHDQDADLLNFLHQYDQDVDYKNGVQFFDPAVSLSDEEQALKLLETARAFKKINHGAQEFFKSVVWSDNNLRLQEAVVTFKGTSYSLKEIILNPSLYQQLEYSLAMYLKPQTAEAIPKYQIPGTPEYNEAIDVIYDFLPPNSKFEIHSAIDSVCNDSLFSTMLTDMIIQNDFEENILAEIISGIQGIEENENFSNNETAQMRVKDFLKKYGVEVIPIELSDIR